MEDIKYAGIVPLVGGMMFGAEKALNRKPEFILSYPEFNGNDSMLTEYWKDVPYHLIDSATNELSNNYKLPKVDFVSTLCPCAGLSQLNNGKNRGASGTQNDWMYKTSEFVLEKMNPYVLWGENAPGLYSNIGIPVVEKLQTIGKKYGYSMSLLKTTTMLHGIPQNRIRSFYFFWKSEFSPILSWIKKPMTPINDYLSFIKQSGAHDDEIEDKTSELQNDPLYIWMKQEYGDWRAFMKREKGSMIDCIISSNKAQDYIEWAKVNFPDHVKKVAHAYSKRSQGMGFWDSSPFLPGEHTGAFTGARMNAIHPTEDRIFTRRELMHFMGLPNDMKIPKPENMGRIFQNVPSSTSADWTSEVVKFIKGELVKSDVSFLKQDNISERIETFKNKAVSLF